MKRSILGSSPFVCLVRSVVSGGARAGSTIAATVSLGAADRVALLDGQLYLSMVTADQAPVQARVVVPRSFGRFRRD